MAQAGKIRVIKRESRQAEGAQAAPAPRAAAAKRPEREVKDVVSGWVRDHQQRADEFRRNFAHLLRDMGFAPPQLTTGR